MMPMHTLGHVMHILGLSWTQSAYITWMCDKAQKPAWQDPKCAWAEGSTKMCLGTTPGAISDKQKGQSEKKKKQAMLLYCLQ